MVFSVDALFSNTLTASTFLGVLKYYTGPQPNLHPIGAQALFAFRLSSPLGAFILNNVKPTVGLMLIERGLVAWCVHCTSTYC